MTSSMYTHIPVYIIHIWPQICSIHICLGWRSERRAKLAWQWHSHSQKHFLNSVGAPRFPGHRVGQQRSPRAHHSSLTLLLYSHVPFWSSSLLLTFFSLIKDTWLRDRGTAVCCQEALKWDVLHFFDGQWGWAIAPTLFQFHLSSIVFLWIFVPAKTLLNSLLFSLKTSCNIYCRVTHHNLLPGLQSSGLHRWYLSNRCFLRVLWL